MAGHARLTDVKLSRSLLEYANFRSCIIEGGVFVGSNLRDAVFDRAKLVNLNSQPVDLSYAELGRTSFIGATLDSIKLLGAKFSEPTSVRAFLLTTSHEMRNGAWDEAATVLATIGKRATEDWDFPSADMAAFTAMTCRHRRAISARSLTPESNCYSAAWFDWVIPSWHAGFRGFGWLINRAIWGYGLRPTYLLIAMLVVILFFGVSIFPFVNVNCTSGCSDYAIANTLVFSLNTFVGLTYSPALPQDLLSALLAGLEALAGNILLAMFLVALAGKYLRRFGG